MKVTFAPVPKRARYFYLAGFLLIMLVMADWHLGFDRVPPVLRLQVLIIGALLVVAGSAINLWTQFRPDPDRKTPRNSDQ